MYDISNLLPWRASAVDIEQRDAVFKRADDHNTGYITAKQLANQLSYIDDTIPQLLQIALAIASSSAPSHSQMCNARIDRQDLRPLLLALVRTADACTVIGLKPTDAVTRQQFAVLLPLLRSWADASGMHPYGSDLTYDDMLRDNTAIDPDGTNDQELCALAHVLIRSASVGLWDGPLDPTTNPNALSRFSNDFATPQSLSSNRNPPSVRSDHTLITFPQQKPAFNPARSGQQPLSILQRRLLSAAASGATVRGFVCVGDSRQPLPAGVTALQRLPMCASKSAFHTHASGGMWGITLMLGGDVGVLSPTGDVDVFKPAVFAGAPAGPLPPYRDGSDHHRMSDGGVGNTRGSADVDRDDQSHSPHGHGSVAVDVAVGGGHVVVVSASGIAYSWGLGRDGQLGVGATGNTASPAAMSLPPGAHVAACAAGRAHTLLLMTDGKVYACGANAHGQIGQGGAYCATTVRCVTALLRGDAAGEGGCVRVAAGDNSSVFVMSSGAVFVSGELAGALGVTAHVGKARPAATTPQRLGLPAGVRVVDAAVGGHHIVLLTDSGNVLCGGSNVFGQAAPEARPAAEYRPVAFVNPIRVDGRHLPARSVAAGSTWSAAVYDDGSVSLWGTVGRSVHLQLIPSMEVEGVCILRSPIG